MTKEELLALKPHTRIRYIGTDVTILKLVNQSKTAAKKGMVITSVEDHTASSWASYKERGISLSTWSSGSFDKAKPEDWEVVDARRVDLERGREKRLVNLTDRDVRRELDAFSDMFSKLQDAKMSIDIRLNQLSLAAKLNILTTFTEEQKMWFSLLDRDPLQVKSVLLKAFKDLEEQEESSESNGSEFCVPGQAAVCSSDVGNIQPS